MNQQDERLGLQLTTTDEDAADDVLSLAAVARGDRQAFDKLYRRYYERVFRFSLRVTGRMNLVDDVVNETMIVVWRKAGDYRAAAPVSTWIFGIAYRKSLKALSREGKPTEALDRIPDHELQAPDNVDRDGLYAAIREAVTRLPPEHRAVVDLTFFFNCSYEQVAQILNCPVGTVKSRMFHARAKLRPLLNHLLED